MEARLGGCLVLMNTVYVITVQSMICSLVMVPSLLQLLTFANKKHTKSHECMSLSTSPAAHLIGIRTILEMIPLVLSSIMGDVEVLEFN